jgi:flagellar basal-body rod protein FlgF
MIYGLYMSATGVLASSYRQDVIANNLANSETVGFKKDLALFQELGTEARLRGLDPRRHSNPGLESIGGGLRVRPTFVDRSQGELEHTGGAMDVAIHGDGFFAVRQQGRLMLTRDGRFMVNSAGHLAMASSGLEVLDTRQRPIGLRPDLPVTINQAGEITQGKDLMGRIGLFDVPDPQRLRKQGAGLLTYADAERALRPAQATLRSSFVERANVEPAEELARLLDTQRQLEANANMIRYQDQMLGKLVNEVGKIA